MVDADYEICCVALRLDTLTLLHTPFLCHRVGVHTRSLFQRIRVGSRLRPKTEFHVTWWRSAGKRHRKWSRLEALEIRGSSSSRTTLQQAGIATTADLPTLQQQIRTGDCRLTPCSEFGKKCTSAIFGGLDAISSISSVVQNSYEGLSRSSRNSHAVQNHGILILKSSDGTHDERPVQELHGRAALVDASNGQTRVSESWCEWRASTRWIDQHWLWIARKQTSEHSKPLCTKPKTEQQTNH